MFFFVADWIGVGAVYNFRQRPPEVSSKLRSLVISLIDLLDEISRDDNSGDKSVMSIEALSKFRGCIFLLCSTTSMHLYERKECYDNWLKSNSSAVNWAEV